MTKKKPKAKEKEEFDWELLEGMIDNEGFDYYFCDYTSDVFKDVCPKLYAMEQAFVEARAAFKEAVEDALSREIDPMEHPGDEYDT